MAEYYSPWENNGRIEWVYTIQPIGQSSTHCLLTVYAYFKQQTGYQSGYSGSKVWSGGWGSGSAAQTYTVSAGQRIQLVFSQNAIPLTDAGQNIGYAVNASQYFGTTTGSIILYVPPRYAIKPTGLAATRVSDVQHNLTWTRGSTYTSCVVQRRADDGAWQQVGTPTGNAASWTDTTTQANRKYEYRVAGVGGSGQSAWSDSVTVYTTPAPPTAVSARKVGADIEVSATGLPPWATGYDVEDNGSVVSSTVTAFPWLHASPAAAASHTYRVRAKVGSLVGAWSSMSNTVAISAPPSAPTGLKPNGGLAAAETPVPFEWTHNPTDTTAQTAAEFRRRPVGSPTWTTTSITGSGFTSVSLSVGSYEWQVRTRGGHATYSDWSAVATVTVTNRPNVAVTAPPGATWNYPNLNASWSYSQAQSRPQSAWELELLDATNTVVEQRAGSGATNMVPLTTRLLDGLDYTLRVRAAAGEVWSLWAVQAFTVDYIPPDAPAVSAEWDETSGTVSLDVTAGASSGAPATVRIVIRRSVDNGITWEHLVEVDGDSITFTDYESLSFGTTLYQVEAFAASGASIVDIVPVLADSDAVWLSGGPGFSLSVRLPYGPRPVLEDGRERSLEAYEGREKPVAYAGPLVESSVDAIGVVVNDESTSATPDELAALVKNAEPIHLYRDPDGRRKYGSVKGLRQARQSKIRWSYQFTLEESDRS